MTPPGCVRSQLGFEGLVDRLDDLPQWLEQLCCGSLVLAFVGRPQKPLRQSIGVRAGGPRCAGVACACCAPHAYLWS